MAELLSCASEGYTAILNFIAWPNTNPQQNASILQEVDWTGLLRYRASKLKGYFTQLKKSAVAHRHVQRTIDKYF